MQRHDQPGHAVGAGDAGGIGLHQPIAAAGHLAIERYALRHGTLAIGIGWFPTLEGLVFKMVEGMNFHLDFSVVLGSAPNKAARRFFEFAQRWQAIRETAGVLDDTPARTPVS